MLQLTACKRRRQHGMYGVGMARIFHTVPRWSHLHHVNSDRRLIVIISLHRQKRSNIDSGSPQTADLLVQHGYPKIVEASVPRGLQLRPCCILDSNRRGFEMLPNRLHIQLRGSQLSNEVRLTQGVNNRSSLACRGRPMTGLKRHVSAEGWDDPAFSASVCRHPRDGNGVEIPPVCNSIEHSI
ncbi:hypothetical protein BKA93DRAFT_771742 [Sparassis latifolia]